MLIVRLQFLLEVVIETETRRENEASWPSPSGPCGLHWSKREDVFYSVRAVG